VPLLIVLLVSVTASSSEHRQDAEHHHDPKKASPGLLGSYSMTRDASGTSWQPDSTPMDGAHFEAAGFAGMLHGFLNVGWMGETGPRGANEAFGTGMLMLGGRRALGRGTLGLRFMGSIEPVMGPAGYPLLLQTGESADGTTPLLDRQHPHDALMEIAASYGFPVWRDSSVFVYAAPVGEPAIGPPSFMHRASSGGNPLTPITHHWFDSTHIAYGVLTVGGVIANRVKIEGSYFNGREPDENRWNVEELNLDSYSIRVTVNPTPNWSFQASAAELAEPERLHPGIDFLRLNASATYNLPREDGNWQLTVGFGRNQRERATAAVNPLALLPHTHAPSPANLAPVLAQNSLLVESAVRFQDGQGFFVRFEWVQKDELFPITNPFHSAVFPVSKVNVGYTNDFARAAGVTLGAGLAGSLHFVAVPLEPTYGGRPAAVYFFLRAGLR
jgi:hypothetical protein